MDETYENSESDKKSIEICYMLKGKSSAHTE